MSSGLSSSMQTARMLAEDYDGHVRVVNNQRISGTLRYSAIEAIQQAKDANEEYNPSLETRVQFYEDWLADEGNRWQIKRETIEEFRQMVREYPLHLHAESPFLCEEGTSTYQLMRDACEKYASGLSSLDGFLAELSTKMRMVEAENL